MKAAPSMAVPDKALTGIAGFDDITGGGLPRGRTSLVMGGPGSGKTIFALQFLAHGAQHGKEPGIFVAFEEHAERVVVNAGGFGWNLPELQRSRLFFLDAHPHPDLIQSGDFDLSGMLAVLQSKASDMKAQRIVLDALDIVLTMLPDEAARMREIYRLHEWLLAHKLTGLITAKAGGGGDSRSQPFCLMQFMADCTVILNHDVVRGVSQRNLRVQKYRGSRFDEDELPFMIGNSGFEVAIARAVDRVDVKASSERVSSGIGRLDTMLGGGYYRGASVVITGFSGTAKTTLSGAFAEAACSRGERTLFVSFDSDASEVVRNLASVGMGLDRFVKNGLLRMVSARNIAGSAETYLARIKALASEHKARCLVIDPISSWSESSNSLTAHNVTERLIGWAKAEGITLVCTRLLGKMSSLAEDGGSPLQISTMADTWIHLDYLVQAGERNRGLSVIKSRGTAHSNQVRELILSDEGVNITDTYTANGEVLMGTMRWEKERAERSSAEVAEVASKLEGVALDAEEAELEMRMKSLQAELVAKRVEKALLATATRKRERELSHSHIHLLELRGADAAKPAPKASLP
jgi:circadian clock protein KaiC